MDPRLLPVVAMLKKLGVTIDSPVMIEDLASAAGIDVEAPFSYREVAELAERAVGCPYITRTWREAGAMGPTYYSAGAYVPYDAAERAKDEADLAPFLSADCGCGGGADCDEVAIDIATGRAWIEGGVLRRPPAVTVCTCYGSGARNLGCPVHGEGA